MIYTKKFLIKINHPKNSTFSDKNYEFITDKNKKLFQNSVKRNEFEFADILFKRNAVIKNIPVKSKLKSIELNETILTLTWELDKDIPVKELDSLVKTSLKIGWGDDERMFGELEDWVEIYDTEGDKIIGKHYDLASSVEGKIIKHDTYFKGIINGILCYLPVSDPLVKNIIKRKNNCIYSRQKKFKGRFPVFQQRKHQFKLDLIKN